MGDLKYEQNGAGNLSYQQNLVKNHAGLDSLPGYMVAVFERLPKGGESFFKLVNSGERIKIPFLSSSQKYFSIAVNKSILGYSFDEVVTLDDEIHKFTLKFHLKYQATEPQKVAELRELDPLRQLRNEIVQVIGRSCAQRKWEMVRDRFRELEMVVMNNERARLRQYAAGLGIEIRSIELDRRLPDKILQPLQAEEDAETERRKFEIEQDLKRTKEEIVRATEHLRRLEEIENQYSVRGKEMTEQLRLKDRENAIHRADQQRDIDDVEHQYLKRGTELDKELELQTREDSLDRAKQVRTLRRYQTEAIGKALDNVGSGINSPAELLEGAQVAHQISMGLPNDGNVYQPQAGLPQSPANYLAASGEDGVGNLLNQAMKEIDNWNCQFAQKQALRSAILHIVAEALVDDHADEKVLQQYADKLSELGKGLQLTQAQFRFLEQFRKYEQLRKMIR